MQVKIGPCRIADENGTHEPGETIAHPSDALVALANAKTCDPDTKLPYAELVKPASAPAPAPAPMPAPAAPAAPSQKETAG